MSKKVKGEYQFTTTDGKKIYAGDKYWGIAPSNTGSKVVYDALGLPAKVVQATAYPMKHWDKKAPRFSTKKLAQQYLDSQ